MNQGRGSSAGELADGRVNIGYLSPPSRHLQEESDQRGHYDLLWLSAPVLVPASLVSSGPKSANGFWHVARLSEAEGIRQMTHGRLHQSIRLGVRNIMQLQGSASWVSSVHPFGQFIRVCADCRPGLEVTNTRQSVFQLMQWSRFLWTLP